MVQGCYILIATITISLVDSLSSQHKSNISFGSIVRNDLITTDANLGGSTTKGGDDDVAIKFGWTCKFESTHVFPWNHVYKSMGSFACGKILIHLIDSFMLLQLYHI